MERQGVLTALTVSLSIFLGFVFTRIFSVGEPKLLIDFAIGLGTVGAVIVALSQRSQLTRETRSRSYREAAIEHLHIAADSFLNTHDRNGTRPLNTRRHWINFARAIQVARRLASKIELPEQREIWAEQEDVLRERVYDVLHSDFLVYDKDYFWAPKHPLRDRELPIAESSLVIIFGWVSWPVERPDPLDKNLRFTKAQRDAIGLFDAPGMIQYLDEYNPIE